jgi:hypothetical protein
MFVAPQSAFRLRQCALRGELAGSNVVQRKLTGVTCALTELWLPAGTSMGQTPAAPSGRPPDPAEYPRRLPDFAMNDSCLAANSGPSDTHPFVESFECIRFQYD